MYGNFRKLMQNYFDAQRRFYTVGPRSVIKERQRQLIGNIGKAGTAAAGYLFSTPHTPTPGTAQKVAMTTRAVSRRIGAVSSKSAGFTKAKKKYSRKTKKFKHIKNGVTHTLESGNQVSDPYSVYLLHSSLPVNLLLKQIGNCLSKRLLEKFFGRPITNMKGAQIAQDGTQLNLRCDIEYFADLNSSNVSQMVVAETGVLQQMNPDDLGSAIANALHSIAYVNSRPILWKIRFRPHDFTTAQKLIEINLRTARFDIYSKSSMKFQNRTASSLGTEADEVDNIPLYGKTYHAKGSCFRVSDAIRGSTAGGATKVHYCTKQFTGFELVKGDSETTGALREPPQPSYFINCNKFSKIRLEPGAIKTSVLVFKKTMFLTSLMHIWHRLLAVDETAVDHYLGETHMIGLEKILESSVGGEAPPVPINVGYEVNVFMNVNLNEKIGPVVAQTYSKV